MLYRAVLEVLVCGDADAGTDALVLTAFGEVLVRGEFDEWAHVHAVLHGAWEPERVRGAVEHLLGNLGESPIPNPADPEWDIGVEERVLAECRARLALRALYSIGVPDDYGLASAIQQLHDQQWTQQMRRYAALLCPLAEA